MPKSARLTAAVVCLAALGGCRTADSKFPVTGSLFGSIVISNVNIDTSRVPRPREFRFRIRSFEAVLSDETAWSFLGANRSPCNFVYSVSNLLDPLPSTELTRQCGGGGLVLDAGSQGTVSFVLDLEAISAIFAERPDLSAGFDRDGDGVANETDNCPIQFNPRVPIDPEDPDAGFWQPDVNGDGAGDACSFPLEGSTDPTIPDQDLDGVFDGVDNCVWYPNPAGDDGFQPDANRNGIGDACERTVAIVMKQGGRVVCPGLGEAPLDYTVPESGAIFYSMNFTDAIRCDPTFTACDFDPAEVTLLGRAGVPSDATPVACEALP